MNQQKQKQLRDEYYKFKGMNENQLKMLHHYEQYRSDKLYSTEGTIYEHVEDMDWFLSKLEEEERQMEEKSELNKKYKEALEEELKPIRKLANLLPKINEQDF